MKKNPKLVFLATPTGILLLSKMNSHQRQVPEPEKYNGEEDFL
jgi:hypothetical protein